MTAPLSKSRKIRHVVTAGQRFGHLEVVEPEVRVPGSGHRHATCHCDCGADVTLPIHRLLRNRNSCGRRCPFMYSAEDRQRMAERAMALNSIPGINEARARHLAGLRETPEWSAAKSAMMRQRWEEDPEGQVIRQGRRTHGMWSHPMYFTWNGMMQRCYNEQSAAFGGYGALGVTVYEPWHDMPAFAAGLEAEIGPRPDDGRRMSNGRAWFSIDRIDVTGNYEPGNIRWADPKTQRANQRAV